MHQALNILKTFNSMLGNHSPFPASGYTVLPESARVVICGGGVTGCSIAYYLAECGWAGETIVLDMGKLGEGTKWRGSGLIGTFKSSGVESKLVNDSIQLYKSLEENGYKTGWKQVGSLLLARTRDRVTDFKRLKALSVARDIECELISPEKAQEMCPLIQVKDLLGALRLPEDGVADPHLLCTSLASTASVKGVRFIENCTVEGIETANGRVKCVKTNKGTVETQYFVNVAGLWARGIGQLSHPPVKVPIHPCEHYYLYTEPIEGLDSHLPVVRDLDGNVYFRERDGRFLGGAFEKLAKPCFPDGVIPQKFSDLLGEDWDHFHPLLMELLHRVPSLGGAILHKLLNGPEGFSVDGKFILGQVPEIQNYFVAAGMKSAAISAAGGIGQLIANWIVHGDPGMDVNELDITRFLGLHNNPRYLWERMKEVPGWHYRVNFPWREFERSRCLRMSPIFLKLKAAGGVFQQVMGYERACYFDPQGITLPPQGPTGYLPEGTIYDWESSLRIARTETFGKPPWFDLVHGEYLACRERVGICDFSSFTKLELWLAFITGWEKNLLQSNGTEVVDALQYLCSNNVDIPVGRIVHTGMQNAQGGYENDCSVARIARNRYMLIAPTIQQVRSQAWIQRHLPTDGTVSMRDITSMFTALCVMGPMARHLLSDITDVNLSPKTFPFFTFKEIDIGLASEIRAMNLTHTGELGWVLYIPNEYALHVYNCLIEAGKEYGVQNCGYYAMRTLRIEKFYTFWGQDLDTATTPLECGRAFRVYLDKDFIGREALLKQKEEGVKRMLVQLVVENHDVEYDLLPWGGEPIYRDNRFVGQVTTACYGFSMEQPVCVGFIQNPDAEGHPQHVTPEYVNSGDFEIDIAGMRYPTKVNLHSPSLPTKFPEPIKGRYVATQPEMPMSANARS
ncbi:unnamed protein product [Darwinula stevensoni]|uniref:Pyruvate dehydrogenase phosphatase regulatory subunit, mitochondrial n=1 Tax=Darwinula stevensoni TaxID=69355 RepID=A0A7R8X453_9CRUS|nr:unnamed protein product [Darwinula stevensoni]CAG0879333.1 unnamed protein product [Darwinula stevensoni]